MFETGSGSNPIWKSDFVSDLETISKTKYFFFSYLQSLAPIVINADDYLDFDVWMGGMNYWPPMVDIVLRFLRVTYKSGLVTD